MPVPGPRAWLTVLPKQCGSRVRLEAGGRMCTIEERQVDVVRVLSI